jgi:hypothetical protein
VMTRIFYPYPLILFLFSSPFLRALIANPFLILIPSRVLPTVGRFALFGPSLPLPFVSALFVFTCALKGQPPLRTASAAPSHWLRDACATLPLYSLYSHTHSLSSRVLSKSRTATLVPQFSHSVTRRRRRIRHCAVGACGLGVFVFPASRRNLHHSGRLCFCPSNCSFARI